VKDDLAKLFPAKMKAVLEDSDDPPYVSFEDAPIISESPRLVATYRLVSVRLLKKVQKIVAVKQRKRVKK
jgi:hypothetical protein